MVVEGPFGIVEGDKVDTEAMMLFYTEMENREWEFIINSKLSSEINPEDLAHIEFCSAVRRHMIIQSLIRNLTSNYSGNRYWAGTQLYNYWRISKKIEELASTAWN